jgi:putative endonuclease
MEKEFFVYILASGRNGTLYIGVTSDLRKRVCEHKEKVVDGFTKAYGVDKLVWFEECPDAVSAIASEKRLKAWKRAWKLEMIERANPYWRALYEDIDA